MALSQEPVSTSEKTDVSQNLFQKTFDSSRNIFTKISSWLNEEYGKNSIYKTPGSWMQQAKPDRVEHIKELNQIKGK